MEDLFKYVIGFAAGALFAFIAILRAAFNDAKKTVVFKLKLDEFSYKVVEKSVLNDDKGDLVMVSYTLPMEEAKRLYKADKRVLNACLEFGTDSVMSGNAVCANIMAKDYNNLVNRING